MKKFYFFAIFLFLLIIVVSSLKNSIAIKQFILKYGWIIDENSAIIEETKIPKEFEGALSDYNAMLKKSGFNLEKYKGKTVKKYSYKLKNHIDKDAYINIFMLCGKIVFADVVVPRIGGYIHNIDERKYQNAS